MIYLELLDRDNRVIGRQQVEAGSFPVTIRLADGEVEATVASRSSATTDGLVEHSTLSALWSWIMSTRGAVAVITVTAIAFAATTYAHMFTKSGRMMLLGIMFSYMVLFMMWSAGWALGGRIARREGRFRNQFTWTCVCALVILGFGYAARWEEFLFPASEIFAICFALIGVLITIVALYGHLSIASKMSPRRRWRAAVATVGVCVALTGLVVYAGLDEFDTSLIYNSSMQPLDIKFIPAESMGDFTKDVTALQQKVDREAKER